MLGRVLDHRSGSKVFTKSVDARSDSDGTSDALRFGMAPLPPHPRRLLPLWDLMGSAVITSSGSVFEVLELEGLDSEHLDAARLDAAAAAIYDGLKNEFADDTLLQFVVDGHSNYEDRFAEFRAVPEPHDPVLKHQRDERLRFLRSSNLRRNDVVLAVGSRRGFGKQDFDRMEPRVFGERKDHALRLAKLAIAVLDRAGIRSRSISPERLRSRFFAALNPDVAPASSREGKNSVPQLESSPAADLFEHPIVWADDHVRIGRRFHKVLTLGRLPDATEFTMMEAFLQLRCDFRFSVNVGFPDQSKAQSSFLRLRNVANADAHRSAHVADDVRLSRLQEANVLSSVIAETKQKLLLAGLQLVLWADDLAELERRVEQVGEYLRRFGFVFFEEMGRHDVEIMKTLPGMAVAFDRWKLVTSNNAGDLMPIFGACTGDRRPVLLVKTGRGELFSFDPVEEVRDNWNATILGASGSGKSVLMNMLITTAMLSNVTRGRVMVVDFAGETKSSYLMVAKLFGGEFVPILGKGSNAAINPFPALDDAYERPGALRSETLNFLTVFTDMLLVNTGGDKDAQLFRNVLQRGIVETYRRANGAAPTYVDLFRVLHLFDGKGTVDQDRLTTLLALLEGFLRSPDARLFSRQSTVTPKSDFAIFDLFGVEALQSHVREALTFLVCQYVRSLAFSGEGTKYVVLDEVAQLLRQPRMAALVHELYSTSRKHRTSIWTVTQKYSDYVQSAVAGTINLNSTTQLFLSHASAAEARRQIAEDFAFNDRERYLFESLTTKKRKYSEALLRTEVFDRVRREKAPITAKLRIELSPFDYELSTSDATDRARQARGIAQHPELPLVEVLGRLACGRDP